MLSNKLLTEAALLSCMPVIDWRIINLPLIPHIYFISVVECNIETRVLYDTAYCTVCCLNVHQTT